MHYHLEIILPPTDNLELAIQQIMEPFNENPLDDETPNSHPFYDYYLIGGRWSGTKLKQRISKEDLDIFCKLLKKKQITVSSFSAGKRILEPKSQIPIVDAIWREAFPNSQLKVCPLFEHFDEQSPKDVGDILTLAQIDNNLSANHVIIAGIGYDKTRYEAKFMIQKEMWNGVNHIKSEWDGKVETAINIYADELQNRSKEYGDKNTPQPDWLVVTIDYHS